MSIYEEMYVYYEHIIQHWDIICEIVKYVPRVPKLTNQPASQIIQ